jgi:hypothetical protein
MNSSSFRSVWVLLVSAFFISACASGPDTLAPVREATPSPDLSAADVVQIQLIAFGNNNPDDEGIAIAYRFASPGNRTQTGPLPRFAAMVRGPAYEVMLQHDRAEFAPLVLRDGIAIQRVTLYRGQEAAVYDFLLRRQEIEGCGSCWMTEGVFLRGLATQPVENVVMVPFLSYSRTHPTPSRPAFSSKPVL